MQTELVGKMRVERVELFFLQTNVNHNVERLTLQVSLLRVHPQHALERVYVILQHNDVTHAVST